MTNSNLKRMLPSEPAAARGGIGKRRNNVKTDRDGDLVMDSKPQTRDRIRKARGRGGGGRAKQDGISPNSLNHNKGSMQHEMLRQAASGKDTSEGSRIRMSTLSRTDPDLL
jgi:hypothetical protein